MDGVNGWCGHKSATKFKWSNLPILICFSLASKFWVASLSRTPTQQQNISCEPLNVAIGAGVMDFSNLLAQEIRHKRKAAQSSTSRKRHLKHVKTGVQDEQLHEEKDEETKEREEKEEEVDDETHKTDKLEPNQEKNLDLDNHHEHTQHQYNQQQAKEQGTPSLFDKQEIADETLQDKIATQCRKYIKSMLYAWEDQVQLAPDSQPNAKLLIETKRDMVPLLYKLRTGTIHKDLLTSLATTLYYLQVNDMIHANDAYMKMSLGNVVWPIGIVGVGIRETTTIKHANVMIDDTTRRWITAIKRLITRKERHVT